MHADDSYLVLDDGRRVGPFSSHWAACAAMIRRSDPTFRSLGGDKPADLATEGWSCRCGDKCRCPLGVPHGCPNWIRRPA